MPYPKAVPLDRGSDGSWRKGPNNKAPACFPESAQQRCSCASIDPAADQISSTFLQAESWLQGKVAVTLQTGYGGAGRGVVSQERDSDRQQSHEPSNQELKRVSGGNDALNSDYGTTEHAGD